MRGDRVIERNLKSWKRALRRPAPRQLTNIFVNTPSYWEFYPPYPRARPVYIYILYGFTYTYLRSPTRTL